MTAVNAKTHLTRRRFVAFLHYVWFLEKATATDCTTTRHSISKHDLNEALAKNCASVHSFVQPLFLNKKSKFCKEIPMYFFGGIQIQSNHCDCGPISLLFARSFLKHFVIGKGTLKEEDVSKFTSESHNMLVKVPGFIEDVKQFEQNVDILMFWKSLFSIYKDLFHVCNKKLKEGDQTSFRKTFLT